MITTIIFDLGGVLFTNSVHGFAKHISEKHNLDFETVYKVLESSSFGNAYREGKMTRDAFYEALKKELDIDDDTNELEQKWIDGYQVVEATKNIIDELREKYTIYFLSDNVKERAEAVDKQYGFTKWFHGGIFSHEVGVRKPNIQIYEITLEKLHIKPEEALFIDDKAKNLPPAEQLGMKTLLFTSPVQLRSDLEKMKLL